MLERGDLHVLRLALVDAEQRAPDLAPDRIARVRPERRALTEGDEVARGAGRADELGHEPRLAHPRLSGDADDATLPLQRLVEGRGERLQLGATADELELVAPLPSRPRIALTSEKAVTSWVLPFTLSSGSGSHVNESPACSRTAPVAYTSPGGAVDINRAARFTASPRQVNVPAHRVSVRAGPQAAGRDPDLDVGHVGDAVERAKLERGGDRACRIVLVGVRRTEHRIEVGALVAERQLKRLPPNPVSTRWARRTKSLSLAAASSSAS